MVVWAFVGCFCREVVLNARTRAIGVALERLRSMFVSPVDLLIGAAALKTDVKGDGGRVPSVMKRAMPE